MPTDSSSQHPQSQQYSSQNSAETNSADGPIPLPEDSPFLSDHGMGTPAPPPGPYVPPAPPSGVSQFPPTSYAPPGSRQPSSQPPISATPTPAPMDATSTFGVFNPTEDLYASSQSSQASLRANVLGQNSELVERLKSIQITTTDSLQGRLVETYLGLVTAEAIVPTDSLLEGAERTGRFSRYKTSQHKLKSLEQLTLAELKLEADKAGGNAVVGARVQVSMDQGVALVIASGTAVRVV
jgi:uncharacterized protein YbjQ (UPF0145 family)